MANLGSPQHCREVKKAASHHAWPARSAGLSADPLSSPDFTKRNAVDQPRSAAAIPIRQIDTLESWLLRNRFLDQQQLVPLRGQIVQLVASGEMEAAASDGDDRVVAIAFRAIDDDRLLVADAEDRGQPLAVAAEIERAVDFVVAGPLLACIDEQPFAAGFGQIDEPLAVGSEDRRADAVVGLLLLAVNDDELLAAGFGPVGDGGAVGAELRHAEFVIGLPLAAVHDVEELAVAGSLVGACLLSGLKTAPPTRG